MLVLICLFILTSARNATDLFNQYSNCMLTLTMACRVSAPSAHASYSLEESVRRHLTTQVIRSLWENQTAQQVSGFLVGIPYSSLTMICNDIAAHMRRNVLSELRSRLEDIRPKGTALLARNRRDRSSAIAEFDKSRNAALGIQMFSHFELRWMVHLADELVSMAASGSVDSSSPKNIANSIDPAINPGLDSMSVARDTRMRMHALVQGGGNPAALATAVREAHAILIERYRERHQETMANAQNALRAANEARGLYKPELVAIKNEMKEIASIIKSIEE